MPDTSPILGIPTMLGTDLVREADDWSRDLGDFLDAKMVTHAEGLLATRPTSTPGSPGIVGRLFRATDTGEIFQDTGTGWVELAKAPVTADKIATAAAALLGLSQTGTARSGYAQVLTSQNTASSALTDLATVGPSVTVTVPTNGLVSVLAQVDVSKNGAGQADVGLFEDGVAVGNATLIRRAGLGFTTQYTSSEADLSSGLYLGSADRARASWITFPAAAGSRTYKLVYRSASGGTSADFQNRKLWVRAHGY